MSDEFKAGDFTSGKMGEIFKSCFIKDMAVINHKQFGKAYMIPEEIVRVVVINLLSKHNEFYKYSKGICGRNSDIQAFMKLEAKAQMHYIEDFYETEFDTWFEIITAI